MTSRRDGADKVEVTEKMIEAGLEEYNSRWMGLRDLEPDVEREMLEAAFRAMFAHLP